MSYESLERQDWTLPEEEGIKRHIEALYDAGIPTVGIRGKIVPQHPLF